MGIQSIRCALPFCARAEEKQTKCSLITRVAAVALGGIILLVGILALSGIPGLHSLGIVGGAVLTTIGGLILLAGICLRCVKDDFAFADPRATGFPSFREITTIGDETTTHNESYCSLEKFLISTKQNDTAVRERLTKEVAVPDLYLRIKENFGNHKVALALSLKSENDIRDDELLFQILKLIYLPTNELLNQAIEEIKTYDDDQKNILSLRLMHIDSIPQCSPGTLGAFLNAKDAILSDDVSPTLYFLFTKEQVAFFLQNSTNIDKQTVEDLFPSSEYQPFITIRSARLLSELPIEYIHKILPFLSERLIWPLIYRRGQDLNYSLLTDEQVREMLPSSFMEQNKSTRKMEELSIEALNGLLPKMHYQLRLLTDKHLKDKRLNLTTLSENRIRSMFPVSFMEKDKSQQRMSRLHIDVLNQILPNMDSGQLQLVPNNHLGDSRLNLKALTQDKIRSMFPTSFMEKDKSKERVNRLASDNRNYVKNIVKFDRF
jgi:hypothetical protein